ncbi:MAG: 2OG-Fe(II) oxygenase [Gammaproteobacteria bacterium]|nr:2OG-Fe(II) oxygenase [Gammaproteobacteria bacterium]
MDEHLLEALAGIDRPGDVFAAGDRAPAMPGLEIEGLGTVGLPLSKAQARALIRRCRQAPYGKGTQTLVDTDVRRVWEMDPAHFELTNPKWVALIESILGEVQQHLGLEECKLSAHLYKLLLYEKGSFFLSHRDGERLDAMVATLIVALPAKHVGGELVVRHEGHEHEITFPGAASGLELSWAAFYADCPHEVRPLRGGYRLCLVYNVTLARPRRRKRLGAPSYGAVTAKVAELLGAWGREAGETEKRVVTLEHGYTQDGLTPDKLKGADRARAEVLFEAAEQADCIAHLALITLWQLGDVDYDHRDHFYRGRRKYGSRYDDDDDGDPGSGHEMGDIIDTSLTASQWSDRHGNAHQFGEMPVDEDEVVTGDALDDGEPSEEDFEDYTGNAGLTLERWYRRAAIVIWSRERHFAVLCGAGTQAAIGGLDAMVKGLRRGSREQREATRRDGLQFAGAIIDGWKPPGTTWFGDSDAKVDRSLFSKLLCKLDDPGLMRRFLSEILPNDGSAELHREFAKLCRRHGLSGFEAELAQAIGAASEATLLRNAQLLHLLCRQPDHDKRDAAVCARLCESAVAALERFDGQASKDAWRLRKLDRTALLVTLTSAMLELGAQRPLRKLIDHTLAHREHYDLTDTHLAAIFQLESRLGTPSLPGKAIAHWLSACRRELRKRTAQAPQAPTDYRRDAELSCKCADCRVLSRFLANPNERVCRMPLNKDRRGHLHGIIERNRCDVTHVTERRGRPFTLVCTKTTASYERACKAFDRDKHNLSRVVGIEEGLG